MPNTGPEFIDEIAEEPTLDRFLDRNPHVHPLSDQELYDIIQFERAARARWNLKNEKRDMKKQGIEGEEDGNG